MRGIIVEYFPEKGYGFLADENEDRRFFHISNIRQRDEFIKNIEDYYYTDWIERTCYVVDFTPVQNQRGLNAVEISLTNQIFNDLAVSTEFDARITGVKYETESLTRIVTGIGKGIAAPFGATAGGNGTYRIGYPEALRELNIYFRKFLDIGWGTIDVREIALKINDRSKVTESFVNDLENKLTGQVVRVYQEKNKGWTLVEHSILKL